MKLTSEDVTDIQQLYAAYCHLIDEGRSEEFADLFVPEGSIESGGSAVAGTEKLAAFAESVPGATPGIRHVTLNVMVEGGGDEAEGRAYLFAYTSSKEGTVVRATGVYRDSFRRVDGTWKYVARRFTMDR